MIKYCLKCLFPETKPDLEFNEEGVCNACTNYSNRPNIDLVQREKEFLDLISSIKKDNYWDCIIPISGGKDSTRQALWIREKLKLRPLLVCCTYPPEQLTELGAENLSNLIKLGFDLVVTAPGPITWKKFLKRGFYEGNYIRGPELALYSSLPQIAIKYKINLIFWGEGGNGKITDPAVIIKEREFDGNLLRKQNTLKNCDLNWTHNLIEDKEENQHIKFQPLFLPSFQ